MFAFGQDGPARWRPGPLEAVAPVQGFEVDVPAGWEATPTWKGFALRPADPARRGLLAAPVQLDTTYLEAFYNPAGTQLYRDRSMPPARAPFKIRPDPQSRGRFPDGRGWFRTDGLQGRWRTTHWYVSWPYHCEAGKACPDVLAMRALRVAFTADAAAVPEALGLAERLLRSARPITNAVQGQAHAPRPDCLIDRSVVAARHLAPIRLASDRRPGATIRDVEVVWIFRTTRYLVPCVLRAELGMEILDRGRRADVRGNGDTVRLDAVLPEGAPSPVEVGRFWVGVTWFNWCERRPVRIRLIDPLLGDAAVPDAPAPGCHDASKPSRLAMATAR